MKRLTACAQAYSSGLALRSDPTVSGAFLSSSPTGYCLKKVTEFFGHA